MVRIPIVAAAVVGASLIVGLAHGQEGPPPPPGAEVLASGLVTQGGSVLGPDGALYVAEQGSGGDTELTAPPGAGLEGVDIRFGLTAQITRIDTATGEKSVAAAGLPSVTFDGEPAGGPIDVAFLDGDLHYLTTGSADALGATDWPNGVYRVEDDGSSTLVANISEFNNDNPVDFEDAMPGGNPFAFDVRGDGFIVTDGNYNRVLRVDGDGTISILAAFGNVVPTGLEASSGPILMTQLGPFPHDPADGKVVQIGFPSGSVSELASGFSQLIDVQVGPNGNIYVLQFGDQPESPESEEGPPGRLLILQNGQLLPLVEDVIIPVSLNISGDTAFITSLTGSVWRIDGLSSLQPVEPEPTVAPAPPSPVPTARAGVITAPDTGTGSAGGEGGALPLVAAALTLAAVAAGATGIALRRR
ncbi:MAG TPA: ScyD/ScyE family protein [Dehalococcoidia bacterium]|nr:ScyD/ScyE family protein [Dehalococcoidia bacterium]